MTVAAPVEDRSRAILDILSKSRKFTIDLLADNEKLRYRAATLELALEASEIRETLNSLQEELRLAARNSDQSRRSLNKAEDENRQLAKRYVEVEQVNASLTNLYISTYQLHATLEFSEVLKIVKEIIINLIGSECFVILLADGQTGELRPVATEGIERAASLSVTPGEGVLGRVAQTGQSYFREAGAHWEVFSLADPIAAVPLRVGERVIGMIAVYRLLAHKREFSTVDHELFSLLAGQAATALYTAKLYADLKGKLSALDDFLGMLQ